MQDTLYKQEESRLQEPLHIEKHKLEYTISLLKRKSETELVQEFLEYLELYDLQKYRRKLKGLKINPFDMRDNY